MTKSEAKSAAASSPPRPNISYSQARRTISTFSCDIESGRLDDVHRAGRLVRDAVRHAPEHPSVHALVADHQQVRVAPLRESGEHLGRVAVVDHRRALDLSVPEGLLGPAED